MYIIFVAAASEMSYSGFPTPTVGWISSFLSRALKGTPAPLSTSFAPCPKSLRIPGLSVQVNPAGQHNADARLDLRRGNGVYAGTSSCDRGDQSALHVRNWGLDAAEKSCSHKSLHECTC